MSEDSLRKDDLVLMMDSYKNMITMHQTILEQSAKIIELLSNISIRQDSIASRQEKICNILSEISKKLDDCSLKLQTGGDKVESLKSGLGDALKNVSESIKEKINNHNTKSIEDHNKITNKVYIGWIGMGSIILALLSLILIVYIHALHPLMP
jgi:DNA repair exonuclease SbcCD ATPase subunit